MTPRTCQYRQTPGSPQSCVALADPRSRARLVRAGAGRVRVGPDASRGRGSGHQGGSVLIYRTALEETGEIGVAGGTA